MLTFLFFVVVLVLILFPF